LAIILQKLCSRPSGPLWHFSTGCRIGPHATSGPEWPTSLPLARE